MNDEIKEILDYWQFYINEPNNYKLLNVHFDEIKKVLDYITNLQKEKEDYKSRCEKAIELVNEMLERAYINGEYILYDYSTSEILEIKEALNGGDEE